MACSTECKISNGASDTFYASTRYLEDLLYGFQDAVDVHAGLVERLAEVSVHVKLTFEGCNLESLLSNAKRTADIKLLNGKKWLASVSAPD